MHMTTDAMIDDGHTKLDEERMKEALLPHLLQAYWGVSERASGLVKNGDGVWRDSTATERRLGGDHLEEEGE